MIQEAEARVHPQEAREQLQRDRSSWKRFLDRTGVWLGQLAICQARHRRLAEAAAGRLRDPRLRRQMEELAASARRHEEVVEELFRRIARRPSRFGKLRGTLRALADRVLSGIGSFLGGPRRLGPLRALLLSSVESTAAFSLAQQIGFALGLPQIVDVTFPVLEAKAAEHLLLQECLLEMGAVAILEDRPA